MEVVIMTAKKDSTSRRLERSNFGRLLAKAIDLYCIDWPNLLQGADFQLCLDLLDLFERSDSPPLPNLAKHRGHVLRTAQDGDWSLLKQYLEINPPTPDIQKFLIEMSLGGKKRKRAHRPQALATEAERREIAFFVAFRVLSGAGYMAAVKDAQKAFRCSDKKILNACEKNAKVATGVVSLCQCGSVIRSVVNEILRRGVPEYCERARKLLERWEVAREATRDELTALGFSEWRVERLNSALSLWKISSA
jgi:hypothetical protein